MRADEKVAVDDLGAEWGPTELAAPPEMRARSRFRPALRRARLIHAIAQLETLATISVTILATAFLWLYEEYLPAWHWAPVIALLLGAGLSLLLIWIAMHDPELTDPSIAMALESQLHVDNFKTAHIRHQMGLVVAHRTSIEGLSIRGGRNRQSVIAGTLTTIDNWIGVIRQLALMLEPIEVKSASLSAQALDLRQRIEELEGRARNASSVTTQTQLRETLASRKAQLRAIEQLESVTERGLLRLEHAVSALGTMDAKLTIASASAQDEFVIAGIKDDIKREIGEIDLVIAAVQRVYTIAH